MDFDPDGRAVPEAPVAPEAGETHDRAMLLELAGRIRQLRREAGLTLEGLSARSGVSRAMLSKVERGEKNPSLAIVARIASGLGLTVTALLRADAPEAAGADGGVKILRRAARRRYREPATGLEREVLSPGGVIDGVEIVRHRLPAGCSSGPLPAYAIPTWKLVTVERGTLTVEIDGAPHTIEAGDSLWFTVAAPYALTNAGSGIAEYWIVIVRRDG